MITIPDKTEKSNIPLEEILYSFTKQELSKIADTLDLYVSPNINKDKMASRLADEILRNPLEVISRLSISELLILEKFINSEDNEYVELKMKKTPLKLQKWGLTLTYLDFDKNMFYILMPDEVKNALKPIGEQYIALAKEGKKGPTAKEVRLYNFMRSF